jgi:PPM family protein phosphatase
MADRPSESHGEHMNDDWFYLHDGAIYGPAPTAALRLLAAGGKLAPDDSVWAETASPASAVLARTVVFFPESAAPKGATPDWLESVRQAEEAEAASGMVPTVGPMATEPIIPRRGKAPPPFPPHAGQAPVLVPAMPLASPKPSRKTTGGALPEETGQGKLEVGSATSPGMVRPNNEDSFLVLQSSWANLDRRHEMAVVVVADGMGGHQAGERASGLVISAMGKALAPLLAGAVLGSSATTASAFPSAIDLAFGQAHRAVSDAGKADAGCKDMGATAVAVVLLDEEVHIGLVGDCRVYHQRGTHLTQITRDQTIVARMVELGQLSPEEAANHPRGNEVTQAVGRRETIQPVKVERKLRPGDWLIVCCDGLYAHVEEGLLQETIGLWAGSPRALALHLVELANRLGGSDNCTVVTVHWDGVRSAGG